MRLLHNHNGDEGPQTICGLRVISSSSRLSLYLTTPQPYDRLLLRQFLHTCLSNTSTNPLRAVKGTSKVRLDADSQQSLRGPRDKIQSEFQGKPIGKAHKI